MPVQGTQDVLSELAGVLVAVVRRLRQRLQRDVLESIKEVFDANGIEIPFNQMDVNIKHQ